MSLASDGDSWSDALIRSVYRDVDDRVLIDITQEQLPVHDQLLGLEACKVRDFSLGYQRELLYAY